MLAEKMKFSWAHFLVDFPIFPLFFFIYWAFVKGMVHPKNKNSVIIFSLPRQKSGEDS